MSGQDEKRFAKAIEKLRKDLGELNKKLDDREADLMEAKQEGAREALLEVTCIVDEIVIPTFLRFEEKYGFDNQARVNVEAGLQALKQKYPKKEADNG